MASREGEIYSATYSNVPVYELKVGGDHVMRRRSDDWINATHILKIAGFDKPARTRILEREVQKGVHEKIQGGYGKYQGTWVPLNDGRLIAEKNGIADKLTKIFDFVPGDHSPPPAPKHSTAASNKPKAPKAAAPARKIQTHGHSRPAVAQYETVQSQFDEESPEDGTPETGSFIAEDDFLPASQNSTGSRKRKRGVEAVDFASESLQSTAWGDELLDYFLTAGDDPALSNIPLPSPPPGFDINRPIDKHGNNAFHWACAMGDLRVVKDFLARGANPAYQNEQTGETPLIRAVLFTNNHDKQTFPKLVQLLAGTILERDRHGATVFHHIAESARSRSRWNCARYYCEVLLNKMVELGPSFVQTILTSTDVNHDTAALCAVRNGCIKVATFLLNHCPEAGDIPNLKGESANELLRQLREKRDSLEQPASSPMRGGEPFGSRRRPRHGLVASALSRAATQIMTKMGPLMDEAGQKLASMYEAEVKEKDTVIYEAKAALGGLETQRHKVRHEWYALVARAEEFNGQDLTFEVLQSQYEALVHEVESLVEQKEHMVLQSDVLRHDQQTSPTAFRSASHQGLSHEEMGVALPWAVELSRQQARRRELVHEIARLMGEAGTGERVGKHRKLVSIATGLKEDELDAMSEELLDSLEASRPQDGPGMRMLEGIDFAAAAAAADEFLVMAPVDGPRTPPRTTMLGIEAN